MKLEICVETAEDALLAEASGADRIELAAGLAMGGLSPSLVQVRAARASLRIPLVVLVRHRGGGFVHTDLEIARLAEEIALWRDEGVQGVAVGALADGGHEIDARAIDTFRRAAGSLLLTFHRAFDAVREPKGALQTLASLGVQGVLSAGGAPSAAAGISALKAYAEAAPRGLCLIGAGGVRAAEAQTLAREAGLEWVHASASQRVPAPGEPRGLSVSARPEPGSRNALDPAAVRALRIVCDEH